MTLHEIISAEVKPSPSERIPGGEVRVAGTAFPGLWERTAYNIHKEEERGII